LFYVAFYVEWVATVKGGHMKINAEDLISVTEASRQGVSKLVSEASAGRELVLIKNNKPAAVIVGIEKLERLQRIEEDIRLLTMAVVRAATDTGERVTVEDAAARFGIDLNELAAEDAEDEDG
jgi:prevent-host-death family protein